MKTIFIILDGLGDRPIAELGGRTPLECAATPNMDFLTEQGICGLVIPYLFPKENLPTSEGAHIALFGYKDYFLGRGPYEAVGADIKLNKGDIALRVNFATIDKELKIVDRRAGRIENTGSLIKALSGITIEDVRFIIKKSYGHRAVLVMRGKGLSSKISGNDPHKTGTKPKRITALDRSKQAKFTAKVLDEYLERAHQILDRHRVNKKREKPANYLLVRGAGEFSKTPSFKQKYGLRAAGVAGGGLYKGIAKAIGMKLIKAKGATGLADTNLKSKVLTAARALKKYDFVFLHIKAADTFSHDRDFIGKKKFIEKIDKNIKFLTGIKNCLIVITADHSTCCDTGEHCLEPVPILVYGNGKDAVNKFSEKLCGKGGLGKIKQQDLMSTVLGLTFFRE